MISITISITIFCTMEHPLYVDNQWNFCPTLRQSRWSAVNKVVFTISNTGADFHESLWGDLPSSPSIHIPPFPFLSLNQLMGMESA